MLSRGVRDQSLLNAYWVPLNFQGSALLTIAVPAALLKFSSQYTQELAVLASIVAAISMLVPPPVGALSDHLRRRGGHRRPFILLGAALNIVGLLFMVGTSSFALFVGALVVASFGQAISTAAYQALIPEVTPREDWGTSAGYQGVASLVGSVGGLAVASLTSPDATFLWTALVVGLGGVTVAITPEGRWVEPEHVHVTDWHNFRVVFLSRFLTNTGLVLLGTFVLYFFRDVQKVENPSISTGVFGILALVGAIVTAFATGIASDRMPRKHILALAGIPMGLAGAGFALAPDPRFLAFYALLFGLGYGAFLSVGWALAIDAVPQMRDVARDLGIWGIASNLPSIVAPLAGGWILARYANSLAGYRTLFLLAGLSFILASVVIEFVRHAQIQAGQQADRSRADGPPRDFTIQPLAVWLIYPYYHTFYRIRAWGRLPRDRGATLVVLNHQYDLDDKVTISYLARGGPMRNTIYPITGRRLFDTGYMGYKFPWLEWLMRSVNTSSLFYMLGMRPIENMLRTRSIPGFAAVVYKAHGDVPIERVFDAHVLELLGPDARGKNLSYLFRRDTFRTAWDAEVSLKHVNEPYRGEMFDGMRVQVEQDLTNLEALLDRGATLWDTAEGQFTKTGRLSRFRASVKRLLPHAQLFYVIGVSYDVFVGRRFSMLFRVMPGADRNDPPASVKAACPVTVSQLISDWLCTLVGPDVGPDVGPERSSGSTPFEFTEADAVDAVTQRLSGLSPLAFVDPDLASDPRRMTRAALAGLQRLRIVERSPGAESEKMPRFRLTGERTHPRFPHVSDMLSYQANFFDESRSAWRALESRGKGSAVKQG